ncbi:MAG: D-hexose-6-phosphate mutarotase [Gammaproteobacteria bacterium]|nr:D-hexose-6-phosphate mutarotase [Gammaproteobacteria bacterium]
MDLTQSQYINVNSSDNKTHYHIKHPLFSAVISGFGAQLLSFTPAQQLDLLWLSNSAVLDGTAAIRGGIPICWPWFGPAPEKFAGQSQHGYLRSLHWQLSNYVESEQQVALTFELQQPEFIEDKLGLKAKIVFVLSSAAEVQIVSTNIGEQPFELSQAIHTYFNVGSIDDTQIDDLAGVSYFDKLANNKLLQQNGTLDIDQALDRIYLFDQPELNVKTKDRTIKVSGENHDSVIVWNPGEEGAKAIKDFDDDRYQQMLCVEMGVTQGHKLQVGETYTLSQKFSLR